MDTKQFHSLSSKVDRLVDAFEEFRLEDVRLKENITTRLGILEQQLHDDRVQRGAVKASVVGAKIQKGGSLQAAIMGGSIGFVLFLLNILAKYLGIL